MLLVKVPLSLYHCYPCSCHYQPLPFLLQLQLHIGINIAATSIASQDLHVTCHRRNFSKGLKDWASTLNAKPSNPKTLNSNSLALNPQNLGGGQGKAAVHVFILRPLHLYLLSTGDPTCRIIGRSNHLPV